MPWTTYPGGYSGGSGGGSTGGLTLDQIMPLLDGKANVTHSHQISDVSNLQTTLNSKEDKSLKGQPNGYAPLGADNKIPVIHIPNEFKEIKVVNNIAARDALTKYEGLRVHVKDATADPNVTTGWAEYLWDGTNWILVAELESINVVYTWDNIQGKPTSSPTAIDQAVQNSHSVNAPNNSHYLKSETYTKTEVNTLLNTKSNIDHTHAIESLNVSDVTTNNATTEKHGLLPKLSGLVSDVLRGDGTWGAITASGIGTHTHNKADIVDFAHTHNITDVTGLQTALDGKANNVHTHTISQITNLQTTLDGKSNVGHTHSISDITNLQTSLDGKANVSHTHTEAQLTLSDVTTNNATTTRHGFLPKLSGNNTDVLKGDGTFGPITATDIGSHTHAISDINNLQATLNNKSDINHTHDAGAITTGRLSIDRMPSSSTANRFLVVRNINQSPEWGTLTASDIPTHTHTKLQITDFDHTHLIQHITDFPSQTGHSGKYLTTNGSALSWSTISVPTHQHTEADLNLSDVTTGNATTARHGFLPKLMGNASWVLNSNGDWVTPEYLRVNIDSNTISTGNQISPMNLTINSERNNPRMGFTVIPSSNTNSTFTFTNLSYIAYIGMNVPLLIWNQKSSDITIAMPGTGAIYPSGMTSITVKANTIKEIHIMYVNIGGTNRYLITPSADYVVV